MKCEDCKNDKGHEYSYTVIFLHRPLYEGHLCKNCAADRVNVPRTATLDEIREKWRAAPVSLSS